jgi:aldehyde decarbonylase
MHARTNQHHTNERKYALLAPWAARSTLRFFLASEEERDLLRLCVLPVLLLRLLHSQVWISVSRHQTARSKHRIVDKSLDFEQVDRERNWYARRRPRSSSNLYI